MFARTTTQLRRPLIMSTTTHNTSSAIAARRLDLARLQSTQATEPLVLVDRQGPVTVLTLNRPKALNALSSPLFKQLNDELDKASEDDAVRCIVITGGEKVFAGEKGLGSVQF